MRLLFEVYLPSQYFDDFIIDYAHVALYHFLLHLSQIIF